MDFWTIGNKAGLLLYIVLIVLMDPSAASPWYTLAYLLYLCLNMAVSIFKQKRPRQLLILLSAIFVVVCAIRLDPIFALLLPVNLFELLSYYRWRRPVAFVVMLVPLPFLPLSWIPAYSMAAFLSFLLFAGGHALTDKIARMEQERHQLREDLHRLSRSLSENNEYIRQSEYTIKLEERNRLSQQIHDDVGHAMAGALIQMEASRRLLDTDRSKAAELLQNAIAISKEGLERIRLTLKNVKPKSEELGINRLRLFVDMLSAKQPITATLTYDGDMDVITPIQWDIIQKNAKEAVTNSLKYGSATAIHVEVRVLNTFIKTVIADNGKGAHKVVKGLGIVGMEERAASAGGTVIVDGTNGFTVTTLLPYGGR